jgi:hypothetical protein
MTIMNTIKKLFNKNYVTPTVSKEKTTDAKEEATKKKEPYVAVLNVEMKKDNPRNGFFELDWNEYFVRDLKLNGYQGDSEEAIVDQWFKELCGNIAKEQGVASSDVPMGAGYINTKKISEDKSEVS